jgi:hypothetical protein
VTSTALRLPASGGVAGTVVITAAAIAGAGRAQFTVSAVITGGTPGTVYDLIGNDCSDVSSLPDKVWATGLAGPDGTADLTGYAWTGAVADRYWMTLTRRRIIRRARTDDSPGARRRPSRPDRDRALAARGRTLAARGRTSAGQGP